MTDRIAREIALTTNKSFIVQAPAGSGKTELLIQRFLALLATVEEPEQVISITFTRKAAAEMRARILKALRDSADQSPTTEEHEKQTRKLANAALQRSQQLQWDLITQPQRLRVDTLDALNAWLAQRLPVLSGGVFGTTVLENANENYVEATRRVLGELGKPGDPGDRLHSLLQRVDNRLERLEKLLSELLPRREQWGPYLGTGSDTELLHALGRSLENLVKDELKRLATAIPEAAMPEIIALLQHASETATDAAFNSALSNWRDHNTTLPVTSDHLGSWQALAELLLIKSQKWRTQLPANLGFGASNDNEKARLRDLIIALEPETELLSLLHNIRSLPSPHYDEGQWKILTDLRVVLRYLTAELRVVFAERNSVDFVEMGLAARSALGEADAPSELLLALDHHIQHVLIDELQDTSYVQLALLELLTAGWQRDDGRTLFLVGDPMQSIYRFREADMSLFLEIKAQGIGNIHFESLTLTRNFRSTPTIIDWVNKTFPDIFPARDNIGAGSARFHPCESVLNPSPDSSVKFHALRSDESQVEVDKVIELLVHEREQYPKDSVAILVQSRSHLAGLHEQLRVRKLDVHAVELEPPSKHQVVQDLLGLTRALTHPADRIAWLSVLRAPWCGMTWSDLHDLVMNKKDHTIWTLMNDPERVRRLSKNGRLRLTRCRNSLQRAFECRAEQPLPRWIERTWVTLGGPACLNNSEELEHSDRFFVSLAEIERRGDLDDPPSLEFFFSDPHKQGEVPAQSGVEIMTIHRAKGLEFDSVILLGLGRVPRSEQAKGLYWLERTANNGQKDLLLAPFSATTSEPNPLIEYLKAVELRRDYAERARLLYVATTRAKCRLNLVGRLSPDAEKPARQSLLALLWPSVAHRFNGIKTQKEIQAKLESIQPKLRRLPETFDLAIASSVSESVPQTATVIPRPEFEWAGQGALQIGTVVHGTLQRMAEELAEAWDPDRVRDETNRFRAELRLLGVEEGELSATAGRVVEALCCVLTDPTGCWLLQDHAEAASELPLTIKSNAGLEHVRLDRTFVDNGGTRWIIDFKTSAHEGSSIVEFLDSEVERYRSQLERYAAAMAAIDDRPIKVGLYFPLLQAFRDWTPDLV
jgi:ATP-dependent helicase/nuclease subunit A